MNEESSPHFLDHLFGGFAVILCYFLPTGALVRYSSLSELETSILQASEVYGEDGTDGKYYREDGNRRGEIPWHIPSTSSMCTGLQTEDKRFMPIPVLIWKVRYGLFSAEEPREAAVPLPSNLPALEAGPCKRAAKDDWKTEGRDCGSLNSKRFYQRRNHCFIPQHSSLFWQRVWNTKCRPDFFQKEPDRLTVDEAALLVGMINGPGLYNPRKTQHWLLTARNLVISRMEENGNITLPKQQSTVRCQSN